MQIIIQKHLYQVYNSWNDEPSFLLFDSPDMTKQSNQYTAYVYVRPVSIDLDFDPVKISKNAAFAKGLQASLYELRQDFQRRQKEILDKIQEFQALTFEGDNNDDVPF